MIRDQLKDLVVKAIASAQAAGDLPTFEIPSFTLDHPRQSEMGDYAVSVAMQLARIAKMPPPQIAQRIAHQLKQSESSEESHSSRVFDVEVVNAFINIKLAPAFLAAQVDEVLAAGAQWGHINLGHGQRAQVEHGSANPTGYATIGTGRNVVVGDTLANTLAAAGYNVHREWYVNDAGAQVKVFGASVFARYAQALGRDEAMPPKGYLGDDVVQVAERIAKRAGDQFLHMPRTEAVQALGRIGIDEIMQNIRATLARIGIRYDNFFSEESLYSSGLADEMLGVLRQRGLIIEHDGAEWFSADGSPIRAGQGKKRSSAEYADEAEGSNSVADDGDVDSVAEEKGKQLPVQAVVIRSAKVIADPDERATYFASDIPYAWNKVHLRGFNPAVYVWGEDHQADVPRVLAAAKALGLPDGAVRIIIYRFITLVRDGQEVRMGKRKGNAIWIDDVIDEMGADALRYVMLSRSVDTKFVFDIGVLKEQNDSNPVFYVQYGHARACAIERKCAEEHWALEAGEAKSQISGLQFSHPSELALIRKLLELPELVELVATTLQPHHYTTYAREVTQAFSKFYEDCRIKDSPPEVAYARMQLVRAARLTLAKVLGLMGMSAPERM
jgi:arginyl-tRNA synthetase